jgi:hypothetical protein
MVKGRVRAPADDQTRADGATKTNRKFEAERERQRGCQCEKNQMEWIECGDRRVCSDHVGVRGRFGKPQHYCTGSLNLNFDQASSAATGRRGSNRRSGDSGNEKQLEKGESALGVHMRISSRVRYGEQNQPAVYMRM